MLEDTNIALENARMAFPLYPTTGDGPEKMIGWSAPKLPAQAVPGIYMLFVLDRAGVPSLAKRVYLQ